MTLTDFLSRNGLSQSAFAALIGSKPATVNRYARGIRMPRPEVMVRIEDATGGEVRASDFYAEHRARAQADRP